MEEIVSHFFEPLPLGKLTLPNRLVMAPMTRSRARDGVQTPLAADYYGQRAGAGLIITEGTQPCVIGQGYIDTPGVHTPEQVEAWRRVTDAVHERQGRIFVQIMHSGRIGHPSLYPDGALPLAPSAVASGGRMYTPEGMLDHPTPKAMDLEDIARAVEDHISAAKYAMDAGFDGVELHGANGYLIHQFLAPNANRRTDAWGGDVEGRIRFAVEVVTAVAEAIGSHRVGLRISPGNPFNDIAEDTPGEVYGALLERLAGLDLAYLHVL
ncbi:MAG TPA: alkene reductase, partial [Acidimicrobiales bacterium]|nr:alkene reductase [Acidimicrobiales bacterium]